MQKIIAPLIFLLISCSIYSQSITDVTSYRDGDSIVVEYFFNGNLNSNLYLWVSLNGGEWWQGPLSSVKGNLGKNIIRGKNKMIWNVTSDFDIFFGDSILFRVGSGTQNNFSLIDQRDGKKYKTIMFEGAVWMAENLNLETEIGSSYYLNYDSYGETFGRLYNWSTAQNICPKAWHLPDENDWKNLIEKCGGNKNAGNYLKSEYDWSEPYSPDFNLSKFSALPGGYRKQEGQYKYMGNRGLWWTSVDSYIGGYSYTAGSAQYYMLESKKNKIFYQTGLKTDGLSVRCVSDPIFYGQSQPKFYSIINPDCSIRSVPFAVFAINYIEEKTLSWQKQKPNEKRSDYLFRIAEENWKSKQREFAREAEKRYLEEISKTIDWGEIEVGLYNSDSENLKLTSKVFGDFYLHIPINEIVPFRQNLWNLEYTVQDFILEGDSLIISKISIRNPGIGKSYIHVLDATAEYEPLLALNKYYSFDITLQENPVESAKPFNPISASSIIVDNESIQPDKEEFMLNQKIRIPDQKVNTDNNLLNPEFGKFYALLIAVDSYEDALIQDLDEPVNDARKLYDILTTNYLFNPEDVHCLTDPKREDILLSLENLSRTIKPEDNLLIFFAGHGKWDNRIKTGYWLPSDAELGSTTHWFRNSTLRDYIAGIQTKHTLVIADACFSGAIFKSRSISDAVSEASEYSASKLYKLQSRKAMTSGTLETVPDRSVFMLYLTKRLQDNTSKYLSSEELFSTLRNAVLNNSSNIPQYGEIMNAGDEGGDFIFIRRE